MGCCGDKRKGIISGQTTVEYAGGHPINVLGGTTGRVYKFFGCGSRVAIDNRDLGTVITIPGINVVQV